MRTDRVPVFLSYSRKDETLMWELKSHLSPLEREGIISIWYDGCITAGEEWDHQIKKNLAKAKIILLLITVNFVSSPYCNTVELAKAIERHKINEARVIPLILRPCYWEVVTVGGMALGSLQALPKNAKPVSSWTDPDIAYTDIASGLSRTILQLQQELEQAAQIKEEASDMSNWYRLHGLKGIQLNKVYQDFKVSRAAYSRNLNAVSYLWADTLLGNTINAKIQAAGEISFLRVEFNIFPNSFGCNLAIRPQDEQAVQLGGQDYRYLYFQSRIPPVSERDEDDIEDVGLAIRIANGKYQHWEYGSGACEHIQFPINRDGSWTTICIDITNKSRWHHFASDGNPFVNEDERNNADLSVIASVIIKVGRFIPGFRGELAYGKGKVDIKNINLSPTFVR